VFMKYANDTKSLTLCNTILALSYLPLNISPPWPL